MKIYLSGNMTPSADYYDDWTTAFEDDLAMYESNYTCSKSKLKDPTDGKFIVYHDLARLNRCDILVVNLSVTNVTHHLTGAIVEVYEAYNQNKPVYAFYGDGVRSQQSTSPWIQQFVTRQFDEMSDLVEFLVFEENV